MLVHAAVEQSPREPGTGSPVDIAFSLQYTFTRGHVLLGETKTYEHGRNVDVLLSYLLFDQVHLVPIPTFISLLYCTYVIFRNFVYEFCGRVAEKNHSTNKVECRT